MMGKLRGRNRWRAISQWNEYKTTPPIAREKLDEFLESHLIDPSLLRSDNFDAFMVDRQNRLLSLIERATGKVAYTGDFKEEGLDLESDDEST